MTKDTSNSFEGVEIIMSFKVAFIGAGSIGFTREFDS